MQLIDVYIKFGIPPNLQEHMMRVCEIVTFIQKHWIGEHVDWDFTKQLALLHDLGNVVKFDLNKHPEFLGTEQANVERWKKIQAETIAKYGTDDHEATKMMLREIGISEKAVQIVLNKSFSNSVETVASNNVPLKILYYADLRTLPFGIGTLDERLTDVRERMPKYTSRPDFDDLIEACQKLEDQLQENLNVSINEITNTSIKINKSLLKFRIH